LTGAAGVIAVKRIFKGLADGTLVLPPDSTDVALETSAMVLDEPAPAMIPLSEAANDTEIVPTRPFSNLSPDALPPSSIAHFLRAHPTPLTSSQLSPLQITPEDFQLALLEVQPSSKREGFATVPDVTWSDIGALTEVREELSMAIVQPLKRPELFKMVGIDAPCGVLLWGPPGCGKTLLAKAVANESRANFISVKGPELLNKVKLIVSVIDVSVLILLAF
jgi:ribosome biogenesis ATPase